MGVALSPVVIPSVGVRVEIDQADRTVALVDRPKLGKRDRMISSDDERDQPGIDHRAEPFLDHLVRGLDVYRNYGEVPCIDCGDVLEDLDVLVDVVMSL